MRLSVLCLVAMMGCASEPQRIAPEDDAAIDIDAAAAIDAGTARDSAASMADATALADARALDVGQQDSLPPDAQIVRTLCWEGPTDPEDIYCTQEQVCVADGSRAKCLRCGQIGLYACRPAPYTFTCATGILVGCNGAPQVGFCVESLPPGTGGDGQPIARVIVDVTGPGGDDAMSIGVCLGVMAQCGHPGSTDDTCDMV
jgi:hypothetical protein